MIVWVIWWGTGMLCEIAQRLQDAVISPQMVGRHMVGRIGGDEFVILLHNLNTPSAAIQAARTHL